MSSTPFLTENAITKLQPNSRFSRKLEWTRDVTLNHGKKEVGHCLDPDESRDDIFLR